MTAHAKTFSASKFERLMLCPGSAVLCAGAERKASEYAACGTVIHDASAKVLEGGQWPAFGTELTADGFTFRWDAEMQDCGQQYVDYVLGLAGDFLLVEQRVAFGSVIGVDDAEDAFGTADAIVGKGDELIVIDLKTGRGVAVSAGGEHGPNPQLALYATGALDALQDVAGDFTSVRLVIVQPFADGVSEYVMSADDLMNWARSTARSAVCSVRNAQAISAPDQGGMTSTEWEDTFLRPGEKQCRFCDAKATCPALRDEVADAALLSGAPASPEDFGNADVMEVTAAPEPAWLSAALSKVDLIEDWCKAVRAEAERRLVNGEPVPGYKLVAGKRGRRAWSDPASTEKLFKEVFRLKVEEMYDLSLISPTSAEKLHKAGAIGPRQWAKVTGLITQSEGKPHVAPADDPRPAITVAAQAEDFDLA